MSAGLSMPYGGRIDRHVIVVDSEPTATSAKADTFLRIQKGFRLRGPLDTRALLKGHEVPESVVGGVAVNPCGKLLSK
ncbi:MAG: hypothetical protein U0936_05605 [Planctomycetaceae bacterium]